MKHLFNKNIYSKETPIWFMRQAGRYLPEYQNIRKNFSDFIEFCYTPEAVCEVTLQPIKRFDFDAAIIFSDILVVLDALNAKVEFLKNHGPQVSFSIVDNFKMTDDFIEKLDPVYKGIKLTKSHLNDKMLYGFAGAPWTLACYLIEQKSSKDFSATRAFAYKNPEKFYQILDVLTEAVIIHLKEQIKAGVDIVQIFDSWAGILTPVQIRNWVIKPTKKIIEELKKSYPDIPIVAFPKSISTMYREFITTTKPDVIGLDFTFNEYEQIKDLDVIIQGNLDPCALFADKDMLENMVKKTLDDFKDKKHIFNLGHGILPTTPIENVEFVIDIVKNYKK